MPYTSRGKCVYKKDTGEKVGCTKGSVKKYLTALRMNAESVDMRKIVREEIEDFEWIRDTEEMSPCELVRTLKVGDKFSVFGRDRGVELNGNVATVIKIERGNPYRIWIQLDEKIVRGGVMSDITQFFIDCHFRSYGTDVYEQYPKNMLFKPLNNINESDDFDWIGDVSEFNYTEGSEIKPVDGYYYYNEAGGERYGPINGYNHAIVHGIHKAGGKDYYEVSLHNIIGVPLGTKYFLSVSEVDDHESTLNRF